MNLRTEIQIETKLELSPISKTIFLGSCFSDNVGGRFQSLGLPAVVNPFGVIFHPFPLLEILSMALNDGSSYSMSDLYEYKGVFYSTAHHGRYSSKNANELLELLNENLAEFKKSIVDSDLLCLTLGTAWGYSMNENTVANCHKLPQKLFSKTLSSVSAVEAKLSGVLSALQRKFPDLNTILTVSPVRHIKDGLVENSRSKAHLLSAVHSVCESLENVSYFPAYELIVDDLRDYRFFKKDMIHPSELAVDYIFQSFKKFAFTGHEVFSELEKFKQLSSHKVMTNDEVKKTEFEELVKQKRENLLEKFPMLKMS